MRRAQLIVDEEKARLEDFLANRKRWIIGLSLAALFLVYTTAQDYIKFDKQFHKADRLATAHVVEVDPGEPASGAGEDADPGRLPSSRYQFQVNGVTYDGWLGDELRSGDEIVIRYNSSDPTLSHAQDDHPTFRNYNRSELFCLMVVVAALALVIWNRKPDESEPQIDIGDGSFESLRRGWIERLHCNPTPAKEAKIREFADKFQKLKQQERASKQKITEALDKEFGT
jgi:hypothetical protein